MPTVLVLAALADGVPTRPSLELLTLARRVGEPVAVVLDEVGEQAAASLAAHGAGHHAGGGTVTVTASRRFGVLADGSAPSGEPPESCEVELRCSWTPSTTEAGALVAHLSAFCDLLATTAGRPPETPGVITLRRRS